MSRTMLIDTTDSEETRVVVLNKSRLEEFDHESASRKQLKGNIYLAKVTRVEPSLQAAFVDYGGNRHGFLPFSEIHPDYYRIPIADREALKAEEAALRDAGGDEDDEEERKPSRRGRRSSARSRRRQVKSAPAEAEPEAPDESESETDAQDEAAAPESGGGDFEALAADIAEDEAEAPDADEEPEADEAPEDDTLEDDEAEDDTGGDDESPDEEETPEIEAADGEQSGEPGAAKANGVDENGEAGELEEVEVESRVETVGGDEADDEARRRAIMARRYKIQEVIKRRQVLLVQVTKEERGNKGAALTTYLSLAGRYCVLMPNTNKGGGISRKIANVTDRRRLKKVISELEIPDGMAVIVRTAGSQRSKVEIRRDYEYLLRLWNEIRENTLKSNAPSLIHEEANLIKRSIRDLYARDMEEIVVAGEEGYKSAKAFMRSLMPSHAKKVQLHKEDGQPLFQQFGIERQLDEMHSATVQLASGGYIVLNPTEALVAIDVNSGRATKERHIEETALKTNLEAASEIARQLRLRDLAGLIVIDFIDMEESRHNRDVERRLKDAMRLDRARIQLGRISPFGLLELSRQRLRPSLFESSTVPCPHCEGRGFVRTTESAALHVLRMLDDHGQKKRGGEIALSVPTAIGFYILNQKRDRLLEVQQRHGFRVEVTADDSLIAPAFELTHLGGESLREEPTRGRRPDERRRSDERRRADERAVEDERDDEGRKRRRRRRSSRQRDDEAERRTNGAAAPETADEDSDAAELEAEELDAGRDDERDEDRPRSRRRRGRRGGRRRSRQRDETRQDEAAAAAEDGAEGPTAEEPVAEEPVAEEAPGETSEETVEAAPTEAVAEGDGEEPAKGRRPRRSRRGGTRGTAKQADDQAPEAAQAEAAGGEDAMPEAKPDAKPAGRRRRGGRKAAEAPAAESASSESSAETPAPPPECGPAAEPPALNAAGGNGGTPRESGEDALPPVSGGPEADDDADRPKRRGWWSRLLQ